MVGLPPGKQSILLKLQDKNTRPELRATDVL